MPPSRKEIDSAKHVKKDEQGRRISAADSNWSLGFSYNNSFDEAYKNAMLGMIGAGTKPNQVLTLWQTQYWLSEPSGPGLEVGFDFADL